jgi:sRNA-binding regulator protein Hfq
MNTLRVITQQEYDGAVSGQKKFFDTLIEKGQAKMLTAEAPPELAQKDERKQGPLNRLKGKQVCLLLTNEQVLQGSLSEVWQYELILDAPERLYTVLKHAVIMAWEGDNVV